MEDVKLEQNNEVIESENQVETLESENKETEAKVEETYKEMSPFKLILR